VLLALAFALLAALNLILWLVGRRRAREAAEADLEALSPYANFGGLVGAAHMRSSGLGEGLGEERVVRESAEPVRFRLEDVPGRGDVSEP
jgi:hypothetical protein